MNLNTEHYYYKKQNKNKTNNKLILISNCDMYKYIKEKIFFPATKQLNFNKSNRRIYNTNRE